MIVFDGLNIGSSNDYLPMDLRIAGLNLQETSVDVLGAYINKSPMKINVGPLTNIARFAPNYNHTFLVRNGSVY